MLNQVLANFYEKDLRKLIEEVNLFQNEENLWKTLGTVKNLSGNLVLHIIGGLNHFLEPSSPITGMCETATWSSAKRGWRGQSWWRNWRR